MKTALVHDWLIFPGGAEKVLEQLVHCLPEAPLYTLLQGKNFFPQTDVHTSFLQKMPFALQHYRYYLPLFPRAIQQFDLKVYDLIFSSSHAVAKGVRRHREQLHLCYCHSPLRYAWDMEELYLSSLGPFQKSVARQVLAYLRKWDLKTSQGVDHYIANSHFVAERILRLYGKTSTVIYPPVATHLFSADAKRENFYVTVSRLVPYKRLDLILEAFKRLPYQKLYLIGEGPEEVSLRKQAPPNVTFCSFLSGPEMRDYLQRAKGFIFAAEEDFGIAVVEAQAAGTPVIAYGKGGVLESVRAGETGLFFKEQNPSSLVERIEEFEKREWNPHTIKSHAEQFSEKRFRKEITYFVEEKWKEFCENRHSSRR